MNPLDTLQQRYPEADFSIYFSFLAACKSTRKEKGKTLYRSERRGMRFTTPGFEMLGALAQDGGIPYEEFTEYGANI